MNERIKELAGQAGFKPYYDIGTGEVDPDGQAVTLPNWSTTDPWISMVQKFAELIVQKCVQELEASKKGDIYTGDLFNCEWNDCIDSQIAMLKEEFGLDS